MQRPKRGAVAGSRKDQLVAAPKAGLEMWQDRADQDPQAGPGDRPEDPNRNSTSRCPQIIVSRDVVHRWAEGLIRGDDLITQPALHRREIDGLEPA